MLDGLKDWLSSLDAALAIVLAVAAIYLFFRKRITRLWQRRPQQVRRAQAAKLDQLGLGRPLARLEEVLGHPHFQPEEARADRLYRLPGAWVVLRSNAGVVEAFSITVTDSKLYYDTERITGSLVAVRLGRSTFADAPLIGSSEKFDIYARFATFVRYYDYGSNAGGGQFLWLAHNPRGAGVMEGDAYASGVFAPDHAGDPASRERGVRPDHAKIVVNTLSVSGWNAHKSMLNSGIHGPHPDWIRRDN